MLWVVETDPDTWEQMCHGPFETPDQCARVMASLAVVRYQTGYGHLRVGWIEAGTPDEACIIMREAPRMDLTGTRPQG